MFWTVNIPLTSTLLNVLALYVYLKPSIQGELSVPNLGVPKNLKLLENVIGKVIVPLPLLFNEKSPPWLNTYCDIPRTNDRFPCAIEVIYTVPKTISINIFINPQCVSS